MKNEIWKPIIGYENLYEISNLGNVKSLNAYNHKKELIMSCPVHHSGYKIVILSKNKHRKTFLVHQLVSEAFLNKTIFKSMPDENKKHIDLSKLEINHIDENKLNNNVLNLEWCTSKYNCNYGNRNSKVGKHSEKTVNQYDLNGNFIKKWKSISQASRELKIFNSGIVLCCKGKYKSCKGFIWRYAD